MSSKSPPPLTPTFNHPSKEKWSKDLVESTKGKDSTFVVTKNHVREQQKGLLTKEFDKHK
jgi:hypothetical protein